MNTLLGYSQDKVQLGSREDHNKVHQTNYELFLGSTHKKGSDFFTLGIDYEHRFQFAKNKIGMGLLMDYEFSKKIDQREFLITPTFFYFPDPHIKLFLGYGAAFHKQKTSDNRYHNEVLAVFRSGIGYEFDVTDTLVISPSFYADYHSNNLWAFVAGLSIGIGN